MLLDAAATAARLPYPALAAEIGLLLRDPAVGVPPRLVPELPGGSHLFVMPAYDARIAIAKLISFTPTNAGRGRPTIQGDVVVFDVATGERRLLLDGPTVTARRTAAVSLLAARLLAPEPAGPLLVVGAGVQGRAHVDAFVEGLGVRELVIASRSEASAQALARHADGLGVRVRCTGDPDAALADCPLVVTCTPARQVVLRALPRADAFVAAVGAFTPSMQELDPGLVQQLAARGQVVVDTVEAVHEAGDLLKAGLAVDALPTLADVVNGRGTLRRDGPVLFKSCGWAGWDLAAARLAVPAA